MNAGWVVEYSLERDSYHIDPLEKALKNNLRRCLTGNREQQENNDYQIIAIENTIEEAHIVLNQIMSLRTKALSLHR